MRITTLIFGLFLSLSGLTQNTISGYVLSAKGDSLPGVNVWVKDSFNGTSTDKSGYFELTVPDSCSILASFIGYQKTEIAVFSENREIQITLKETVNELSAVSITAGTIEVNEKATSVVMKPIDILTTAGAVGDITGALNTLPGTATVANDGRLFVRGGDANETAIFFDGLRVGNAYGTTAANLPTRNRFNPTLFKGTFFSTGGYSAEYGDALSSVLSLQSIDKPVRNQTDISLMSVGGSVASSFVGKKQSVTAEVSGFDLGPYQNVIEQNFDWEQAPKSYSGQVVYRHDVGKSGMLKAFFQGSSSSLELWRPNPGVEGRGTRTAVDNDFLFGNVSLAGQLGNKWRSEGGLSISQNEDRFALGDENYGQENTLIHIKEKLTYYPSNQVKIRFGAETFLRDYAEIDLNHERERGYQEVRSAGFSELEWYPSNDFTLKGGLRLGYSDLANQWAIEPRIAAAYRIYEDGSISFAGGLFSQPQNDEYRLIRNRMNDQQANHIQLSFQHGSSDRTFRLEIYNKEYESLGVLNDQGAFAKADGGGYARGTDLFFRDRKSIDNLDYWVTYSYVKSRRQFGLFSEQVQPSFAPEHNFSVVAKYWIEVLKSQVGASFAANSGYTYDDPNLHGQMESKSPNYASLSINWSYLVRQNLIIHLACNNILGRENIFGYNYSSQPDSEGQFSSLPIGQPADRFVFVGIFWTLSSDKQANQLNNL